MERFWMALMLFCMKRLGFAYLDIKNDKTGELVEAITVSNNKTYIDAVSEIETEQG